MTDADQIHMRRAIALARPNLGQTAENPSVGCVIVRDGTVAGVVVACQDASPYADGQGLASLAAAGVRVRLGVLAEEAQALYRAYVPKASGD